MPKPTAAISSIVSGLLLLMVSPGCAPRPADLPAPPPIAIKVDPPRPPAELTACAERPEGLPEDPGLIAQIPTRLRAAIIRLARAFNGNADRLDRLTNWTVPGACPGQE